MIKKPNKSIDRSDRAAMFVDYDNLYSILKAQSAKNSPTSSFATEILEEVQRYLEEGDDTPTIYGRAYAAYDTLLEEGEEEVPGELHRQGIEPVYVPAAMQNNTSELRLSIDLACFLRERPDIQTMVIVTGNRPYLPLVRRIRESGRRALVAAVNPPQTLDEPSFAEDELYLDARNLLSQDSREILLANAPENGTAYTQANGTGNPNPRRYQSLTDPVARRTVEITEEHFGQYDEVYLTPLLRKLSDVLGSGHDPKSLVSDLEAAGAVRLEKRNGYPYNYTVLIVNEDHPDVQEIHDEFYDGRSTLEEEVDVKEVNENGHDSEEGSSSDLEDTDAPVVEEDLEAENSYDHDEQIIDEALSPSENVTEEVSTEPSLETEEVDPSSEEAPSLDESSEDGMR